MNMTCPHCGRNSPCTCSDCQLGQAGKVSWGQEIPTDDIDSRSAAAAAADSIVVQSTLQLAWNVARQIFGKQATPKIALEVYHLFNREAYRGRPITRRHSRKNPVVIV